MDKSQKLGYYARHAGLGFRNCGNGHLQVHCIDRTVNWWPDSKRKTLHLTVNGKSAETRHNVNNPSDVLRIAINHKES